MSSAPPVLGATLRVSPAGAGGGLCPLSPPNGNGIMGAGRGVWVKIRASAAERAEWHAKAGAAGLTLSDLVRRAIGRVQSWTVAHAEVECERTRELARIGTNLNQIARWANTFKANAEALEVVAHLVAIERALDTLAVEVEGDRQPRIELDREDPDKLLKIPTRVERRGV